jgi:hypothetical protein
MVIKVLAYSLVLAVTQRSALNLILIFLPPFAQPHHTQKANLFPAPEAASI